MAMYAANEMATAKAPDACVEEKDVGNAAAAAAEAAATTMTSMPAVTLAEATAVVTADVRARARARARWRQSVWLCIVSYFISVSYERNVEEHVSSEYSCTW